MAGKDGQKDSDRLLDRWLRFTPALEIRYEAESGAARTQDIRETIYLGLVLFNIHNLTNVFLIPDIVSFAAALRIVVVTPVSLMMMAYLPKMSPALREYTAFSIVLGAFLIEVVLFWLTKAPLGPYAFSEFP